MTTVRRAAKPPRHPLNPRIAGLRLSVLVAHYRVRLRRQLAGELMAGAGVAVGVALVFGALLAGSSITGSAPALIRAVDGNATVQVSARSPAGLPESLAQRAGDLPGVRIAAFLLRANARIGAPSRTRSVQIVGVTPDIVALHGAATRHLGTGAALFSGGVGLPGPLADALGVHAGERIRVLAAGDAHMVAVRAVLSAAAIGPAAQAPIVLMRLDIAQRLAQRPGRVSEMLIEPAGNDSAAGAAAARQRVIARLRALLGGAAAVTPAAHELTVLDSTAKPLGQSTSLFAAIGAIVGLLFVLNAMLLTLPERRRMLAELHTQGFTPGQVRTVLLFQALILGLLGSAVGLALGDLLAHTLFRQSTVYLAAAFPIEAHQSVPVAITLLALAGGVAVAVIASLPPLLDLRAGRTPVSSAVATEQQPQRVGARAIRALATLATLLVAVASALALADPALTILGGVLLALAVPCLIPLLFAATLAALRHVGARMHGGTLSLAAIELRVTATRSIALIGVAAIAVYGSVAVQGARSNLTGGLDAAVVEFLDTADVWVAPDQNFLTIDSFRAGGAVAAVARAPGVASVRPYQGSLLDVGSRRLWLRARSGGDSHLIQASQLTHGNLARAEARLRRGGWAAVSGAFATERHLHVGSPFTLPAPGAPGGEAPLRVAAITTNAGWSPGALSINLADYRRWWREGRPTALEVNLKPGVSPTAGAAAVRRALAGRPGLQVQTLRKRVASFEASAREGLRPLGDISTLLLITAALAVAAVLSASIWQRRARLAALKAHGFDHLQLWRALIVESILAVAIGCLGGTLLGLYGHALASRWLALSTGFPAPFALDLAGIGITLATVAGITLLLALPLGLQSARVAPELAFQDEP